MQILIKKINTDFLASANAGINIELTRSVVTKTYDQALQAFCNLVNLKFLLDVGGRNRLQRHINTLYDRGRGDRAGREGHGRGGQTRARDNAITITLTHGCEIEYHTSYTFPPHIFQLIKQSDKDLMKSQREECKWSRNQQRQVNFVGTQGNDNATPPASVPQQHGRTNSQVNQVMTGTATAMGGSNKQATQRNNTN